MIISRRQHLHDPRTIETGATRNCIDLAETAAVDSTTRDPCRTRQESSRVTSDSSSSIYSRSSLFTATKTQQSKNVRQSCFG